MNLTSKSKMIIKRLLRKIPGIRQILCKADVINNTIIRQQDEIKLLQQATADMYRAINIITNQLECLNSKMEIQQKRYLLQKNALKKSAGIPVKVVFLIEELSVIKNVLTVIEELRADARFEVVLVNLWFKDLTTGTYKRPNIESVIDISKYTVLEAYDKKAGKWLSLEELSPDYVFFSRPYDHYREESYHIKAVSEYTRTCYIPYGVQVIGGEVERQVLTPECAHLYYFFMDNAVRKNFISERMEGTPLLKEGHLIYCGYPGMDMLLKHEEIKELDSKKFTILWLPRWRTSENNCHFFDYKDVLAEYVNKIKNARVILRPHSLCFSNFLHTGEMTEKEYSKLRNDYSAPNEIDETSNYIEAFRASSVLVADETSLIPEYFLTEKPVVFCKKETHFSLLMDKLIEGCYVVNSEEELVCVLNQLKDGNDVLKTKREEITKEVLLDYGVSAASNIKEELWSDYYGR